MQKACAKWSAIVLAAALALSIVFSASTAFADSSISFTSDAPESCQLSGTEIHISGVATADAPPGQLQQYAVDIDWGDGTHTTPLEPGDFGSGSGLSGAKPFSDSHTYSVPGTYSVMATVYHQNIHGQDNVSTEAGEFVVCIVSPLEISKTADTSLTRTWTWSLTKTNNAPNPVTLASGQAFPVDYTVSANATSTDSNWAVSGDISITNPTGNPNITVAVTDTLSQDGTVTVTCPQNTIAPGATLVCTYSTTVPDGDTQTNTASVVVTGISVLNDSAQASVDFSSATVTKVDDCASVSDSNPLGPQGVSVCSTDSLPKNINYSVVFGHNAPNTDVNVACGDSTNNNTATLTTNTNSAQTTAQSSVNFHIDCPLGCTLTQGYWKTHNTSFKGGASKFADATWAQITPNAQDTTFLGTSNTQTWFQTFWTAPAGNVWYTLAHQYMAARLNRLKGTSVPPSVQDAIMQAQTLLSGTNPTAAASIKGATKTTWTNLAGTLGNYNEGKAGVPHCSEQNPS